MEDRSQCQGVVHVFRRSSPAREHRQNGPSAALPGKDGPGLADVEGPEGRGGRPPARVTGGALRWQQLCGKGVAQLEDSRVVAGAPIPCESTWAEPVCGLRGREDCEGQERRGRPFKSPFQ